MLCYIASPQGHSQFFDVISGVPYTLAKITHLLLYPSLWLQVPGWSSQFLPLFPIWSACNVSSGCHDLWEMATRSCKPREPLLYGEKRLRTRPVLCYILGCFAVTYCALSCTAKLTIAALIVLWNSKFCVQIWTSLILLTISPQKMFLIERDHKNKHKNVYLLLWSKCP